MWGIPKDWSKRRLPWYQSRKGSQLGLLRKVKGTRRSAMMRGGRGAGRGPAARGLMKPSRWLFLAGRLSWLLMEIAAGPGKGPEAFPGRAQPCWEPPGRTPPRRGLGCLAGDGWSLERSQPFPVKQSLPCAAPGPSAPAWGGCWGGQHSGGDESVEEPVLGPVPTASPSPCQKLLEPPPQLCDPQVAAGAWPGWGEVVQTPSSGGHGGQWGYKGGCRAWWGSVGPHGADRGQRGPWGW